MRPHEGASLIGMAFVAEFIHRIRLDHLWPKIAVMIVTVRTFHFSFSYGVVGLFIFLSPYGPMADIAKVWLVGL
jgi:hypothetical protein